MHYYQFNIGDYHSHTSHLDPLEDIAYRRMIDWCFLHERQLPNNTEEIARLIRMRSHCECIAVVLREFFTATDDGYFSSRIQKEIDAYATKSKKAKESADARWAKHKGLTDANALRTDCERNANHKPLTSNQEPITNNQKEEKHKASDHCEKKQRPRAPSIPYQKIVDLYHELLPELTRCEKLTETRKRYIKSIWLDDMGDLEYWRNFFVFVSKSDFLMGKTNQQGRRPFKANLEWITKPANYLKIYEDQYHG